jgi:hypothetical protein
VSPSRISLLLALLLPFACVGPLVEVEAGLSGGPCRPEPTPCDPGYACSEAGSCYDVAEPCADYGCGTGTCRVVDDTPFCECPAGSIHAVGSAACRRVGDVPQPPPGAAGGLCLAPDGDCNDGVTCNREHNYCYLPDDPCVGFGCGGVERGRCEPVDGQPSCLCAEGFEHGTYLLYCCPLGGSDDPVCNR